MGHREESGRRQEVVRGRRRRPRACLPRAGQAGHPGRRRRRTWRLAHDLLVCRGPGRPGGGARGQGARGDGLSGSQGADRQRRRSQQRQGTALRAGSDQRLCRRVSEGEQPTLATAGGGGGWACHGGRQKLDDRLERVQQSRPRSTRDRPDAVAALLRL